MLGAEVEGVVSPDRKKENIKSEIFKKNICEASLTGPYRAQNSTGTVRCLLCNACTLHRYAFRAKNL